MWTRIPYSARIGLPVLRDVREAAQKTDFATTEKHGRKKTEKYARNTTEFLISEDLGKVWPPLIITMIALHIVVRVAFQACLGNIVSLRYSLNPIKWGPPNRIKFSLCFLPIFCLFLFFLSSPHNLILVVGFPCFLLGFGPAKRLPVPYLQYNTY